VSEHEPEQERIAEAGDEAEPEAELEAEPEAEPEEEPEAGEAERAEPEARAPTAGELKRFEAENTRHEKALAKIVGADWEGFAACEECGGVGFRPRELMAAPELVAMPDAIECPGCKGYGRLLTPSRVPGQEFQVCVECAGNGWKRREPYAGAAVDVTIAATAGNGYTPPAGHVLVKVDPNAPDVPIAQPVHAVPAPPVLP
jgi:DnaJ-class molecular chaperone